MTRRILVTRPLSADDDLPHRLEAHGFVPIHVPCVEIDRVSAAGELEAMLRGLDGADWLVITSANGAAALADSMDATGIRLPAATCVAAVGPATATALTRAGIRVDHVPGAYRTAAIAPGLGDVSGRRVVLARADSATPDLTDALKARGASVEEVVAYRTVEGPASSRDHIRSALYRDLDGVTFTSGSTVRGLLRLASPVDRGRARSVPAFCIGPPTAETARRYGFDVAATASVHTSAALADTIAAHFAPVLA